MLEEKRKKREEAKKAAEEAKRKKLAAKGVTPAAEPEEPKEETCVIDNLLKEIRAGTTLKRTGQTSIRHRRQTTQLKKTDLKKLNQIVEKAATSPRKPKDLQFEFQTVAEEKENSVDATGKPVGVEIPNGDQQEVTSVEERTSGDSTGVETKASSGHNEGMPTSDKARPSVATEPTTNQSENAPAQSLAPVANGESQTHLKAEEESVPVEKDSLPRANGESQVHLEAEVKSVPVEEDSLPRANGADFTPTAKSVPTEDVGVPVAKKENNPRLEVEPKPVPIQENPLPKANGESVRHLKVEPQSVPVKRDHPVPVANEASNAQVKVEAKSVKKEKKWRVSRALSKSKPKRATSPLVGDTPAKSPNVATSPANDHFLHEKGAAICQTIKSSGGSLEEERDATSQSRESSASSMDPMVSSGMDSLCCTSSALAVALAVE